MEATEQAKCLSGNPVNNCLCRSCVQRHIKGGLHKLELTRPGKETLRGTEASMTRMNLWEWKQIAFISPTVFVLNRREKVKPVKFFHNKSYLAGYLSLRTTIARCKRLVYFFGVLRQVDPRSWWMILHGRWTLSPASQCLLHSSTCCPSRGHYRLTKPIAIEVPWYSTMLEDRTALLTTCLYQSSCIWRALLSMVGHNHAFHVRMSWYRCLQHCPFVFSTT